MLWFDATSPFFSIFFLNDDKLDTMQQGPKKHTHSSAFSTGCWQVDTNQSRIGAATQFDTVSNAKMFDCANVISSHQKATAVISTAAVQKQDFC